MNQPSMTPRKAAIYLRISLDREMDGLAIDRQREQCDALAKYRQWQVVETYVDQSKSATDRTKVRPAYDQMVADYKAGAFDAIICYDLDRLTRQPRQLEDWIDASELRGLALVTANGDADLSTGCYTAGGTGDIPSLSDFEDAYQGQWDSSREYAERLADDIGLTDGWPEEATRYFDWGAGPETCASTTPSPTPPMVASSCSATTELA
jgi:hypothetical protein